MREATTLAMDGVPPGIDPAEVHQRLLALPGVGEVHDLHIWALSTTHTAATAHLVADADGVALILAATTLLQREFAIAHCTFQVESSATAGHCALRPETVV